MRVVGEPTPTGYCPTSAAFMRSTRVRKSLAPEVMQGDRRLCLIELDLAPHLGVLDLVRVQAGQPERELIDRHAGHLLAAASRVVCGDIPTHEFFPLVG